MLATAGGIAGLASFLLFGLQPLTISTMNGWHSSAAVVQFFQLTYLFGVLLTAGTVNLSPKADVCLAAALFFPAAAYTLVMAIPNGLQRLGDIAPLAIWLASASTIMIRAMGAALPLENLQPYSIIAASNTGAMSGVVLWLHPSRPSAESVWLAATVTLLMIGIGLVMLLYLAAKLPESSRKRRDINFPWSTYHTALWFILSMMTSLALVMAYQKLGSSNQNESHATSLSLSISAMPLLVFLLAYVVSWLPRSASSTQSHLPLALHGLSIFFIYVVTAAVSHAAIFTLPLLYLFCVACVEALRRLAPNPALATRFQVVQAMGGACGGWLALTL